MRFIKLVSIRDKLVLIILTVAAVVILLNFLFAMLLWVQAQKSAMVAELRVQARLVSEHCQAPLFFEDYTSLEENMQILTLTPNVTDAYIFGSAGQRLAQYYAPGIQPQPFSPEETIPGTFSGKYFVVRESIRAEGRLIGDIYIRATTEPLDRAIRNFALFLSALLGISLLIAISLAGPLQATISRPLLYLTDILKRVSASGDYSIRINRESGDEIGLLYNGFNQLLDRIQQNQRLRDEAEQAIRQSEIKYRSLFDSASDAIFFHDLEGHFFDVNQAACDRLGYSKEELMKMRHQQIDPPEFVREVPNRIEEAMQNSQVIFESVHLAKDGTRIPVEISSRYILYQGVPTIISYARDITERKRIETAFRESEEKYRHLIHHSGDAIYLLFNNRFEVINQKFTSIFGLTIEDVNKPGFNFINLVAEESRELVLERSQRVESGQQVELKYEFTAINSSGQNIEVEATVTHVAYKGGTATQGILRDITERKRLEDQLRQAQKMEAVGQLAGGIAHDFNNLLTIINGYSDLMLSWKPETRLAGPLEQIKTAGRRATRLTAQLLAFSRKQIIQPKIINLNQIIAEHMKMLGRLLGEDIEIATLLKANLANVKADPGQIEQIIMNITINARDAMPYGGKMTIETDQAAFDENYVRQHLGAEPGRFVMLAISDTGVGMDEAVRARIFEPFFTTKGRDRGTGLGLATVYGIVKQNHGFIYVYSEPDHGTTFKVYLPLIDENSQAEHKSDKDSARFFGHETILLVEDEPGVREVTRTTLTDFGYTIHTAANGEEALRLYNHNSEQFDLLLTDVIMPLMGGKELAERLKADHPDLKIIFFSGYTDNSIVHHGVLQEGVSFIQKPFAMDDLALKIREVLDGHQPSKTI